MCHCCTDRRNLVGPSGLCDRDIDRFEVNKAFAAAAIPMKFMRDLDIDPDRVNVAGGAIALSHPIGAAGAMVVGTLLDELERLAKPWAW